MGMGTSTTHPMVAAEWRGIAMECVSVNCGDSDLAGMFLAGGSSQTVSVGASIIAAQRELVKQLLDLTGADSPLHGLTPDQVATRREALAKPLTRADGMATLQSSTGPAETRSALRPVLLRLRRWAAGPCIPSEPCSPRSK
jgi:CO/xanthine dehydrogenase Mo-binding subunit